MALQQHTSADTLAYEYLNERVIMQPLVIVSICRICGLLLLLLLLFWRLSTLCYVRHFVCCQTTADGRGLIIQSQTEGLTLAEMDGELNPSFARRRMLLVRPVHVSAGSETVCRNLHSRLLSAVKQVGRLPAGTDWGQSDGCSGRCVRPPHTRDHARAGLGGILWRTSRLFSASGLR